MRQYDLYIIDDLFANYYYGRERMFYNLFKEFESAPKDLKKTILNQVDYITIPIPSLRIHTLITQHLQSFQHFLIDNGCYYLKSQKGQASLKILKGKMIIESKGDFDIEMKFMDVLAKSEHHFFAVDLENERYGWVKPIKEKLIISRKYQNI